MADIGQSSAVTTTTTPDYYTNYISDLAKQGMAAAPTYVGAQPLQTQAYNAAQTNVGNYQSGLDAAGNLINKGAGVDITGAANPYLTAGTSSSADLVGGYMNPYTQNVVDQIRMANQQNIAQNLSPGITAGAVGSGQFGSQRGANALALGISNADIGALAQQAAALQSGYSDALKAAQAQRAAQVNAGQIAGNMATQEAQKNRDLATSRMNLANQQQTQGIADVNQLATMGAQQQQIAQNQQLFPLDVLSKKSALLSGAQVPVSTTKTMDASTLSTIATLGSLGAAAFAPGPGVTITNPDGTKTTTPGLSYVDKLVNWFKSGQQGPAPTAYPDKGKGGGTGGGGAASDTIASDGKGGFIDTTTGLPVNADGTPLTGTGGGGGGGGMGAGTTTNIPPMPTNAPAEYHYEWDGSSWNLVPD